MYPFHDILIIDDEEDILEILRVAIEFQSDIEIYFASNGEDGIRKTNLVKPDLILLDVLMPGMDGLQVMDHLKNNQILKDIPVIFLTSRVLKSQTQTYLNKGAIGFIEKPFAPLEILDKIQILWTEYTKQKET
ncbi:response regulator receiver domain protein [Leptospira ryugenii]|uniref:Response regulator receiver domain protein n=1 Tax=Leptospira ryugenii TaxID=1917863 RepID=A0A2P2E079_9LEPT|nr:response regulator [Leptospira ryugenii]GBF50278.1 response regulator receiver domain protein [Leptospira ryugenii]